MYRRIQGLAISVILLVVVLLVAIALSIALSSRSSSGNSSQQSAALYATTVISQGANIKAGYDSIASAGQFPMTSLTLDSGTYGLYNPANNGTLRQYPPLAAFVTPGNPGVLTYNTNVKLQGVGGGNASYVLTLAGLTPSVCNHIVSNLYGTGKTAKQSAAISATRNNFVTAAAVDFTSDANHASSSMPEGCFRTTDGTYVYYKDLQDN